MRGGVVYGRAAVMKHFEHAKTMAQAKGDKLTMTLLTPLHGFDFLLESHERALVKDWTDAEYARGSSALVACSSADQPAKKRQKTSKVSNDALSKLEALIKG